MSSRFKSRLVVIPSDPISAYEFKGISARLESYYNPQGLFNEVFALSPLEKGRRQAYGMTIVGVQERDFPYALREIKPDIVRAYGGYWPADLACRNRMRNVPVIVSVHDTNPDLLHKSIQYADLVICMSRVVKDFVLHNNVEPNRVRILPNRVDLSVFSPVQDKSAIQYLNQQFPSGKHILHIGRKSKEKNLETSIRTLEFLTKEYSWVFIGPGDTSAYKELAKQIGVDSRCFWIDAVDNAELPLWYSWCDCMCTPSLWEGFGMVFIEAAACGAAIVTSDIAPMNEYLTHNASALLVQDYENPRALANAIQKICEDSQYRYKLSKGAIEAAQPFDHHRIDAAEVAIYLDAMNLASPSLSRQFELRVWQLQSKASDFISYPFSVSRVHVKQALRRYFPELYPLFKKLYQSLISFTRK